MAIVWSGWWINLFGSKLKVCYSRHICMHTNYKCSEETEETWRDHNPFVTVLGDHLQSEKTRDWTFVCHGHPPKKMTCCLPPVKLTRDKTVHSAPRTQKSLSIDKERVTRSRGQTKYPTNHGALWYNEETLRKKTLKLYTFTHGFVGFKPSNSLPPTVFYSNPAAAIHYVSIKILSPYHSLHSKLPITDAPQMLKVIWLLGRQETDQTQDYHFHVGNAKVSVFPLAIWKWDQRYIHPRSSSWKSLTSFRILSRRLLNMNLLISLSSK